MWFQLYIYIYLHLISTPDDAMKTDIKNTLPFLKNYKADSMNLHLLMVICFKINRPQLTCCRSWRSTGLVVTWVWSARLLSWRMARFKRNAQYLFLVLNCFSTYNEQFHCSQDCDCGVFWSNFIITSYAFNLQIFGARWPSSPRLHTLRPQLQNWWMYVLTWSIA